MARIYIEKLSKIVVDNIKSGAYSNKELDRIYEEVKRRQRWKQKASCARRSLR